VPAGGVFGDAAHYEIDLIARLRPGVSIDQATSELATITKRLEATARPDHPRGLMPVVRSFEEVIVGDVRLAMLSLFGAVALVLLIAAANVANLLLLRGEVRSRELAVRTALGATRGRILSLLFAESLILATAAGAAAFVASWWSLQALLALIPSGLPRGDAIRIDARVLAVWRWRPPSCPDWHPCAGISWRNCAPDIMEATECSDAARLWPHKSDLR
jgi:hypothetical protein